MRRKPCHFFLDPGLTLFSLRNMQYIYIFPQNGDRLQNEVRGADPSRQSSRLAKSVTTTVSGDTCVFYFIKMFTSPCSSFFVLYLFCVLECMDVFFLLLLFVPLLLFLGDTKLTYESCSYRTCAAVCSRSLHQPCEIKCHYSLTTVRLLPTVVCSLLQRHLLVSCCSYTLETL